jgi:hypothetical protein
MSAQRVSDINDAQAPLLRNNIAALATGEYVFTIRAKSSDVNPSATLHMDIGDKNPVMFTLTSDWKEYTATVRASDFPVPAFIDIYYGATQ